jgi:hypothetical protein
MLLYRTEPSYALFFKGFHRLCPTQTFKTARNYTKVIGFDILKRSKTARNDPKIIGFDPLKRSKTARNGSKVIGFDPLKR